MEILNKKLSEIAVKTFINDKNKPTIVFLHDSLGCIELWRDFPEKLGTLTNCNIIIYDRHGYGKSGNFLSSKREINYLELEAEILNNLLETWNIEKAILFGHSDGGSIALISASKFPEKILAVITEGAHVFVEDITIKGIKTMIRAYEITDLKERLEKYHGTKTEKMFWAWSKTWTNDDFKSWNIESFLPNIKCPSLIIQGEKDEYGSLEQVEKIVTQVKGETLKLVIPKIKHTPHKENPNLILEKCSLFINNLI
ncbi:MAG: alpha/beta hydrolase [Candidatus Sericytochromatia bacterium]